MPRGCTGARTPSHLHPARSSSCCSWLRMETRGQHESHCSISTSLPACGYFPASPPGFLKVYKEACLGHLWVSGGRESHPCSKWTVQVLLSPDLFLPRTCHEGFPKPKHPYPCASQPAAPGNAYQYDGWEATSSRRFYLSPHVWLLV